MKCFAIRYITDHYWIIKGKQQAGDTVQYIQENPLIKSLRGLLPGEKCPDTPAVPTGPLRQESSIKTHHTKSHQELSPSSRHNRSWRDKLPAPLQTRFIFLDRIQGAAAFPWEHSRGS